MRSAWRLLTSNRKAFAGAVLVSAVVVLALLGPVIAGDPGAIAGEPRQAPSWDHPLGTNAQGQDVFAQVVVGARVTLAVGFAVGFAVIFLGALVGVTAGYFGGRVDDALSIATNVFLVIPGLPLAIVLAAYLPPGPLSLAAVLVLAGWAWNARVFRSQALTLRRRDYVSAAIVAGESHLAVIAREMVPNMLSILMSALIGATVYAIGAQVGLEFLGLGDIDSVTWGSNLYWAANDGALITGTWWEFVPTGLGIAFVGFGLVLINFAIDEAANPRLRAMERGSRAPRRESAPAAVRPLGAEAAALEIEDLTISYRGEQAPAVDCVSLTIAPGQFVGLAGESGCGKTTIGKAVLRLLPDSAVVAGRITVAGRDVMRLSEEGMRALRWRDASIVFQSALNALNPVLRIGEQICDTLRAHPTTDAVDPRARAAELLALVGLESTHLDAYPHQLSGGMRQRVVIAIALALQPRLIIMDEPTTALDVIVQRQILERVCELQQELGFAVLFISHDLRLMLEIADVVGVMRRGELVELADATELRDAPKHDYTRELLASGDGRRRRDALDTTAATAATDAPLLRVDGLAKHYGRGHRRCAVLAGVSFEVDSGEIVALVGQSGSGKSTIARILARLESADVGAVHVGGAAAAAMSNRDYRSQVQMIFQDPFASLNPFHRIGYQLARPLVRFGQASRHTVSQAVSALLGSVGIPAAYAERFPHELSGGQRQRAAIARAVAAGPRLVVADEPTSMLDASLRTELLDLLAGLASEGRAGVLFITHDLVSAARYADRVLVLDGGRIVESGTAEQVLSNPRDNYTKSLVAAASFAGHRRSDGEVANSETTAR